MNTNLTTGKLDLGNGRVYEGETFGGSQVGYVSGRQLYTANGVSAVQAGAAGLLLI